MSRLDYEDRLRSLRNRSVITQAMIWLFLLVAMLVALTTAWMTYLEFSTSYSTFLITGPSLALFLILGALPVVISLCAWVWRAQANLHDDGREGLNYSPAWATMTLLIPGANLLLPYGMMRELWNRSHGLESWGARHSAPPVTSWWALFVPGFALNAMLLFLVLFDLLTNIAVLTPPGANPLMMFAATALLIGAGVMLIRILRAITLAQHTVTHVGDTFA